MKVKGYTTKQLRKMSIPEENVEIDKCKEHFGRIIKFYKTLNIIGGLLKRMGYVCLIGFSITTLMTFVMAFINGGDLTIHLDTYGEMYVELILLILFLPCVILASIEIFKNITKF